MYRCAVIAPDGVVGFHEMTFDDCRVLISACTPWHHSAGPSGVTYLELIRLDAGVWAYVDENGKAKGLPENRPATYFAHMLGRNIGVFDFISGPMIVLGRNGDCDISEKAVEMLDELIARIKLSPHAPP